MAGPGDWGHWGSGSMRSMMSCRVFLRGRDVERTHKQICKLMYYMLVCHFDTDIQTAEFYLFCMTMHALEYFSRTVLTPVVGDVSVEKKKKNFKECQHLQKHS